MPVYFRWSPALAMGSSCVVALLIGSFAEAAAKPLRFVMIPKLPHPWFELVRDGADAAARMISAQTTTPAVVDYRPPRPLGTDLAGRDSAGSDPLTAPRHHH